MVGGEGIRFGDGVGICGEFKGEGRVKKVEEVLKVKRWKCGKNEG